jgi:serine protease Do
MNQLKKTAAALSLAVAAGLAFEGGKSLVENVQFAHAQEAVQTTRQQLQSVEDLSTVFRDVGKTVEPSVVQIVVTKTVHNAGPARGGLPDDQYLRKFFRDHGMNVPGGGNNGDDQNNGGGDGSDDGSNEQQEVGTGSGVIIETDGSTAYILTNNHVAGGASEMIVTLADGRIIKGGKTIGADAKADLAVVKIKADHVIAAKWGDSDALDRGDWVLAFGSPFGYVGSMTHGIVSALNRTNVGILGNQGYENFIQVDAPINPGNSGGPLVNIHGEVVGINTAIASRSGAFSGIGFAIPSSEAKGIYKMLKEKGKVTRGWLGVSIEDVQRDPGLAKSFGFDDDKGVIVQQVIAGTPSFGHLQEGDIVTSIDGKPVTSVQELRNEVAMISPGTTVKMGVFRDKKETEVDLTIGEQPDNVMAMGPRGNGIAPNSDAHTEAASIGLHLSNVTDELAQKFNLGDDQKKGALVTEVAPRSLAAKAGIMPGDLITRVAGKKVDDATEAADELDKANLKDGIRLYITSGEGSTKSNRGISDKLMPRFFVG